MANYDNSNKENDANSPKKKREQYNRHRNTNGKTSFMVLTIFLTLVVTVLFFIICNAFFFRVKHISISGNRYYTNEKLIAASGIEFNNAIFSIDLSEAKKDILGELGYIKDVKISILLPYTIKITVLNDIGVYSVKLGGEHYVLSEDFKVLCKESDIIQGSIVYEESEEDEEGSDESQNENIKIDTKILFKTKTIKKCFVGQNILFSDVDTENIIRMFYNLSLENDIANKIKEINIEDKFNIYLVYDNQFKLKFGNFEDAEIKLKTALAIIEKLKEDESEHNYSRGIIDVTDKKEGIFFSTNDIH